MDCSTPGFPVHHQLLEIAQTHVHRVSDAIHSSHPVMPFSSCLQSFPASGFSSNESVLPIRWQSIGGSASVSVLPMNIQDWFPLRLTCLISLHVYVLDRYIFYIDKYICTHIYIYTSIKIYRYHWLALFLWRALIQFPLFLFVLFILFLLIFFPN